MFLNIHDISRKVDVQLLAELVQLCAEERSEGERLWKFVESTSGSQNSWRAAQERLISDIYQNCHECIG
jgi:hypothetical protein